MLDAVRGTLEREGMLLVQDARLPSLVTLVAGEAIRGSWWGHAKSEAIFGVIQAIEDDPDVARFKVLDGKVALVHRALWSALACIGRAQEPWQMRDLGPFAEALLTRVDGGERVQETGPHVKELERRLLVVGDQKHVETGEHRTELVSWKVFAKEHDVSLRRRSTAKAKAELEEVRDRWAEQTGKRAKLPWDG